MLTHKTCTGPTFETTYLRYVPTHRDINNATIRSIFFDQQAYFLPGGRHLRINFRADSPAPQFLHLKKDQNRQTHCLRQTFAASATHVAMHRRYAKARGETRI